MCHVHVYIYVLKQVDVEKRFMESIIYSLVIYIILATVIIGSHNKCVVVCFQHIITFMIEKKKAVVIKTLLIIVLKYIPYFTYMIFWCNVL